MLRQRLLFGFIMAGVLTALFVLDARWSGADAPPAPSWLSATLGMTHLAAAPVAGVLALLVALGAVELRRLLLQAGHASGVLVPVVMSVVLILVPFVAGNRAGDQVARMFDDMQGSIIALAVAFLLASISVIRRRQTAGSAGAIATTMLPVIYMGVLGAFVLRIRMFGPPGATWLLLYVLATVKSCDIGAYFTGMAIGRHKMIEWLSPKKTWEGLAGGIAFSVLVAVGIPVLVEQWSPASRDLFPPPLAAVLFGVLMAVVGQLGDLVESLFKRDAGAKDSARAIPAFGGVLDILDSVLLAAPVAWWILLS